MADQAAPQAEKVVLSSERQAEVLRTLMLNVSDRVAFLGRVTDKEDLQFTYGKAAEEMTRIQALLASGVPAPEMKGTSWPVIEAAFLAMRNSLIARKVIAKPEEKK